MGKIPGAPSLDAWFERAEVVEIGSDCVRIACLEDLAAMKRASGRPKDLIHLMEIEALLKLDEDR